MRIRRFGLIQEIKLDLLIFGLCIFCCSMCLVKADDARCIRFAIRMVQTSGDSLDKSDCANRAPTYLGSMDTNAIPTIFTAMRHEVRRWFYRRITPQSGRRDPERRHATPTRFASGLPLLAHREAEVNRRWNAIQPQKTQDALFGQRLLASWQDKFQTRRRRDQRQSASGQFRDDVQ